MKTKKYIFGLLSVCWLSTAPIQTMERTDFAELPVELWNMIVTYLSWHDLVQISLACKTWEILASNLINHRIGSGSSYNFLKLHAEKLYELNQIARKQPKEKFTPRHLNKRIRKLAKNKDIQLLYKKLELIKLFVAGGYLNGIDRNKKLNIEYTLDNEEYDFAYFLLGLGSRLPSKTSYFSTDILKLIYDICKQANDKELTELLKTQCHLFKDTIIPNFLLKNNKSFLEHCCNFSKFPEASAGFYDRADILFRLGAGSLFFSRFAQCKISNTENLVIQIKYLECAEKVVDILYRLGVNLIPILQNMCNQMGDKKIIIALMNHIDFKQGEITKLRQKYSYLRRIINEKNEAMLYPHMAIDD